VDAGELQRVRGELEAFAAEVFAGFARSDQRATGLTYLRGLMLDGQRKSMQPMAARLGTDHQRLQQFLTSSTWDYVAVRRRLTARAVEVVRPQVWIVDDTGFPKDGKASPGVARQYSGTLGKVANCQIAVSLHAATDQASAVLDWRLFLPPSWDETTVPDGEGRAVNPYVSSRSQRWDSGTTLGVAGEPKVKLPKPPPTPGQIIARRTASKIPDQVRYVPKWQLALDMIDELAGWGHAPSDHGAVLVADAGYGQVGAFRAGLSERGIRYVVAVVSTTTVHPAAAAPEPVPYAGVGKHPRPRYPRDPVSVKTLATTPDPITADLARAQPEAPQGRRLIRQVRWREAARSGPGKRVWMSGWFTATRVRPAGRGVKRDDDGTYPETWLLIQWPSQDATDPSDYWLCDLPADTALDDLVALAKARWRIEHDYRELKTALGLDHFEGRSWNGWHRHVTLVTAAHLFLTTQRLQRPDTGKAMGQNRT
jgi:SRSO17 transposase